MELTDDAARLIAGSLERIGEPDGGLRIQRSERDQNALKTRLVTAPEPGDAVIEQGRARVFIASDVEGLIAPGVLDVKKNGGGFRIVLR